MKVSIIGAGNVGTTLAKRIIENDLADVVLVDIVKGMAEGKCLDLLQAAPIIKHDKTCIGTDDYQHTKNSDIVVITAGFPRKPGMTREDLIEKNGKVVKEIAKKIKQFSPNATIIMVTNPLDVMTYLVYKESGFKPKKVMGMAGVLDSSRFSHFIADELKVSASTIETIVLGSHGDTMVPLLSHTKIEGKPLLSTLSLEKIDELVKKTRGAGAQIVSLLGTGSAYYAPSAACFLMVRAIIKNEKRLLPVSTYLNGEYGLKGLCLGVPVKLGNNGIEEIIELKITEEEKKALHKSADAIKKLVDILKAQNE